METDLAAPTFEQLWADLGGPADARDRVRMAGPAHALPSTFDVTAFAAACAATAGSAVAELAAVRTGRPPAAVRVDRRARSRPIRRAARRASEYIALPAVWLQNAGDYPGADGWIRLHTNYAHHRDAVLAALGVAADREAVARVVATWRVDDLEAAVVDLGGCAAAMRTEAAWLGLPAGAATAGERPIGLGAPIAIDGAVPDLALGDGEAPLAGVRVLDLTRVIAGPTATRYLAAYGAEVLRIDPPGFEEVGALLPEVTAGKRCASLDLGTREGRDAFLDLVVDAHVVVGGLRPDALAGLGLGAEDLRQVNPSVVTVAHDAYGWSGPWAGRRGFDSVVQMTTGIAAAGMDATGVDRPVPLPVQALDHGLGHLLAAAACRALVRLVQEGATSNVRGSLVGAANVVRSLRLPGIVGPEAPVDLGAFASEPGATAWGPLRRVPLAASIEGTKPRYAVDAGPLGRHEPRFTSG